METASTGSYVASSKEGYDYQFVSSPPSSLECSICLLTLKSATVVSCCGNHFCKPCISRVKADKKPCPLCKDPDFSFMLHKGVMREVNSLSIYCSQKHLGCDWTGELGKLSGHLNIGSRESGCDFVEVECTNKCGAKLLRARLSQHVEEMCPKGKASVVDNSRLRLALGAVSDLKKELQEVIEENKKLKGDLYLTQSQLKELTCKVSSLETSTLQLDIKVQDAEREKNEERSRIVRLEEMSQKVTRLERNQMKNSLKIEKFSEDRDKQEEKMKLSIVSLGKQCTPQPPIHFTLHNFYYYKDYDFHWQSEPFYSFPKKYKFMVSIYPNGISKGKGTYLSLFVSILGGEHDSELDWPFRGTVFVEIYNYTLKKWQSRKPVQFEDTDNIGFTGRPEGLNATNPGLGFSQWLRLTELQQDCCHKGMVKFKVENIIQA